MQDLNHEDISSRVKDLRLTTKLSQKEMAKQLGVTQSALSALERGESKLSLNILYKLIVDHQASAYFLLFGTHPMFLKETDVASFDPSNALGTEWEDELKLLRQTIESQMETIATQKKLIDLLEAK